MPQATKPRGSQLLRPCVVNTEGHTPESLQAATTEARIVYAPRQEKPPQWEACEPQQRVAPTHRN